jgi:hypothetical protein
VLETQSLKSYVDGTWSGACGRWQDEMRSWRWGLHGGISGFTRRKRHRAGTLALPATWRPLLCMWGCSKKVLLRCGLPAVGLPSLQKHEPSRSLFFVNYPGSRSRKQMSSLYLSTGFSCKLNPSCGTTPPHPCGSWPDTFSMTPSLGKETIPNVVILAPKTCIDLFLCFSTVFNSVIRCLHFLSQWWRPSIVDISK